MPGLVGLLTRMPYKRAVSELRRMVEALGHEEFYASGMWCDESLGVYAGWTALNGAFADQMPLVNETKDIALVFSGEEFPSPEIRGDLKERGHCIEPEGPSYLVHWYEDDPDFVRQLNGWFHGLLIDKRCGTVTLFNDRYGMHRLYYHRSKETFYFSGEAKAILAVCPETRSLDPMGLGEFIACGCVLQGRTLFAGIKVLPGASQWIFRAGVLEKEGIYFNPREWENEGKLDPEAYYTKIRDIISSNFPRYFSGQQRIAVSLTGGLDSRMIMAWRPDPKANLPCYSFGGMYRDCRDVLVAREVAKACGQSHQVIEVGDEFLSNFPYYAERTVYLTDGCAEVSHSPDFYAHQRAREIAPVRLTGNYGGEVLRRVWFLKPLAELPDGFHRDTDQLFREAVDTYRRGRGSSLSDSVFHQVPLYMYGQLALAQSQLSLRSPYLDNDLIRMVLRGPDSVFADDGLSVRLIVDGNPILGQISLDRGQGRKGFVGACKRFGHNFLFKAEYVFDIGMPDWLARLDHHLSVFHCERFFLGRHKWYHFRVWYKGRLSAYVREMLLDERTVSRQYLNRCRLEGLISDHVNGDRNNSTVIHKMLTLELIQRQLVENYR